MPESYRQPDEDFKPVRAGPKVNDHHAVIAGYADSLFLFTLCLNLGQFGSRGHARPQPPARMPDELRGLDDEVGAADHSLKFVNHIAPVAPVVLAET